METLAERLVTLMNKLQVNKAQFARLIGVNRAKISKYLDKDDNYYPGYGTLKLIGDTFPNLNMTWLITGKEEMWKINFDNSQVKIVEKEKADYEKNKKEVSLTELNDTINNYTTPQVLTKQEILSELVMQNKKLVDIISSNSSTIDNLSKE